VPFHQWTPDAYEGAPTPATTFMAVAVKSAAFAMMLRVLLLSFGDARSASWDAGWPPVLATLAVLTMTVGNLIAGRQESVKRMLAYSSIAHAGYLLIGVAATIRQALAHWVRARAVVRQRPAIAASISRITGSVAAVPPQSAGRNPASVPDRASAAKAPLRQGPVSAVSFARPANASQRAGSATGAGWRQPGVNMPPLCRAGVE
jgi:hypothetical protein